MKPRVLLSTGALRIVRTWHTGFVVEKPDGRDALGRWRWKRVEGDTLKSDVEWLLYQVGRSLVRRENAARKARRRRS